MTTPNAKRFAKSLTFATLLAAVFASPGALAHTDDYLDTQKHANDGQMRMAGAYHLELVVAKDSKEAKSNPVMVYVTEPPGVAVVTPSVTVTARSAVAASVSVSVAVLFPGVGSVTPPGAATVAVLLKLPVAAAEIAHDAV